MARNLPGKGLGQLFPQSRGDLCFHAPGETRLPAASATSPAHRGGDWSVRRHSAKSSGKAPGWTVLTGEGRDIHGGGGSPELLWVWKDDEGLFRSSL